MSIGIGISINRVTVLNGIHVYIIYCYITVQSVSLLIHPNQQDAYFHLFLFMFPAYIIAIASRCVNASAATEDSAIV